MGLNMAVGVLAGYEEDDRYARRVHADFAAIRGLLARVGARPWSEPVLNEEEREEFEAWGYSGLHALRRLAVHLAASGQLPEPLDETWQATGDPLLKKVYEELPSDPPGPFDHLIHHSDCEGYYVPVDFAHVIVDAEAPGGGLGSSVRLLAETRRLADVLGLPEDLDPHAEEISEAADSGDPAAEGWRRYGVESYMCLQLLRAAKRSISTGAAIAFV
ncbi:hypothetical protein [Streptomyces sp. NPDC059708]|uniref:hypothetical protein n=1 Tax=Streptomyces sp. NPDC059708 TaxID=3346916 RepID=UPI0036ACDCD1